MTLPAFLRGKGSAVAEQQSICAESAIPGAVTTTDGDIYPTIRIDGFDGATKAPRDITIILPGRESWSDFINMCREHMEAAYGPNGFARHDGADEEPASPVGGYL